jgi:hypothetical protein
MSNWPPPVATSAVTFCRRTFSGSVTYLTLIPYCFVNFEVRDCITIMSPLLTVAIFKVGWPARPDDWALPIPTSRARLKTTAPPRLSARLDKRISAPFIGSWLRASGTRLCVCDEIRVSSLVCITRGRRRVKRPRFGRF